MTKFEAYITTEFARFDIMISKIEFIEEDTLATSDEGRQFFMTSGSDDDQLVFVDTANEENVFAFDIPEEGFDD